MRTPTEICALKTLVGVPVRSAILGLTGLIGMFVFSELSEIKETEFLLLTLPIILPSYVFAKVAVTGYPPRLLMFTLGDKRK